MVLYSNCWDQICRAHDSGVDMGYSLVSLVDKQGASYMQPGARLLIREDGPFWGEISAGCLEEKIVDQAIACMRSGTHRLVTIDTRPLYGCFGAITLLIESINDPDAFNKLVEEVRGARIQRRALHLATDYSDLHSATLTRKIDAALPDSDSVLQETIQAPPRLIVLGDWPDGRAVAKLAEQLGWEISLHDASAPFFSIDKILEAKRTDCRTALIVATHNLTRDASCLREALRHPFGYIGVIGSRKRRHELARLMADFDNDELLAAFDQIRCPAGLDLGGQGAQSIALSIVAEIQACLTGREAIQLTKRRIPIHSEEPAQ